MPGTPATKLESEGAAEVASSFRPVSAGANLYIKVRSRGPETVHQSLPCVCPRHVKWQRRRSAPIHGSSAASPGKALALRHRSVPRTVQRGCDGGGDGCATAARPLRSERAPSPRTSPSFSASPARPRDAGETLEPRPWSPGAHRSAKLVIVDSTPYLRNS